MYATLLGSIKVNACMSATTPTKKIWKVYSIFLFLVNKNDISDRSVTTLFIHQLRNEALNARKNLADAAISLESAM